MNDQMMYYMSTAQVSGEVVVETERGLVSDSRRVLLGEEKLVEPAILHIKMGRKHCDFIASTYVDINLVSERFAAGLQESAFSGIEFVKTEIYDKSGNRVNRTYFIMVVNGRLGKIDWSNSAIIEKPPRVPSGRPYRVHKGLHFEKSSLEQKDFSVPVGSGMVIISSRVAEWIVRSKMTNVCLCLCEEYESSSIIN